MQHANSTVSMANLTSPTRPALTDDDRRRTDIQSISPSFNQSMLINTHITPPNHFVQQRQGAILARGIILKSDSFPTDVTSSIKPSGNQSLDVHLLGAPNMRQVRPFPLFGLGQPTMSGIRAMLNFLKAKQPVDQPNNSSIIQPPVLESTQSMSPLPPSHHINQSNNQSNGLPSRIVHWIMTREEPIIYLNNRPFVLRELATPYHNLLDFSGIDVDRLDLIEMRLKEEILIEARCNDGNFLVHDELSNGEVRACFESVSESSLRTSREVFQQLKEEGYLCELRRVPITAESVMAPKQFDEIVTAIQQSRNLTYDLSKPPMFHASSMPPLQSTINQPNQPLQILVFNCQLGRGRSTMAMIIAFLYNCHSLSIEPEILSPEAARKALQHDEHDGMGAFHAGEWDVILKLVRMLHNGRRAKFSVDCAIDACGHVHNVRETIVRAFVKAEHSRGATQRVEYAEEMAAALKRYFWLICFQSWLMDQPTVPTTETSFESFQKFVGQHPELSVLSSAFIGPDSIVELMPETTATPETINQLASECHPLDTAVFARSAPVLSRFSIVKSEFFAPQGRHRSIELSAIMKNYRSLHELHISATAQPNVSGLRTILNDLQNHHLHPLSSHHQPSPNHRVMMINLREEPVLFLCHEPFLLRDWRHPFQILPEFTTGVTANRIEQIETALKSDIINELTVNKKQAIERRHSPVPPEDFSRLLIHEESSERQIEPRFLTLQPEDVLTNRQVFEQLRKEGYNLDYHRVPLHAEEAPSARSIERLFNLLNNLHHDQLIGVDVSVVFVDQTGGRRCTIGMIIGCLIMEHQGTLDLRVNPDGRASPSHEMLRQLSGDAQHSSGSPRSSVPAVIITEHNHLEPSVVSPTPVSPGAVSQVDSELAPPQLKRVSSTVISVNETNRVDERATNGRGEFKAILSLIRILKRGRAMKEEVDLCIDVCGRVHNLRESISEKVRLYDVNRSGQTNKAELLAAAKLLESYALLIAFNAYLHERSESREEALHHAFNLSAAATDNERQSSNSENAEDSSDDDEESVNDANRQREALLRNEEIDAAGLSNYDAFNPYATKSDKNVDDLPCEDSKADDTVERAISASPTSDADSSSSLSTKQSRKSSMFAIASPSNSPQLVGRSMQPEFTFPTFTQWLRSRPELRLAIELIRTEPEESLKLNQLAVDEKFARAFDRRDGNVLVRGSLLKSDHFVGVVNKNVHQLIEGAINFRPIDAFPVAGTGIPTAEGIARVIQFYLFNAATEESTERPRNQSINQLMDPVVEPAPPFKATALVWMNLREEPILYVNGRPFVVRDADNPYSNLENTGITPRRVEAMERMLKRDALHEARKSATKCELLLHDEDASGNMFAYLERVDENSLKTPREQFDSVFDQLRVQFQTQQSTLPLQVKYYRTPITDEQAPSPAAFDAMIRLLEDGREEPHRAIIANCQMGRGRTTTGLVIACLWCLQRGRFDTNKFSPNTQSTKQFASYEPGIPGHEVSATPSNVSGMSDALMERLKAGWFKVITSLVRVLPNGQAIKAQVDRVIDECSAMQNLRIVCADQQLTALTCLPRKRAFFVRRGTNYLIRYFFLVLFNAYLNEEHSRNFAVSFVDWINQRQETLNLLKRIEFPEVDQPLEEQAST